MFILFSCSMKAEIVVHIWCIRFDYLFLIWHDFLLLEVVLMWNSDISIFAKLKITISHLVGSPFWHALARVGRAPISLQLDVK